MRNLLKLKKENEATMDRIIRDIRNLFEHAEKDYYTPVRESKFLSNNYIEYESNVDRNKTISVEKYLDKIKPYLKGIINALRKFDTSKFN